MPSTSATKTIDIAQLDQMTGGAFTAPTAGERSARVKEWLLTEPSPEKLAEVFKELSSRDKGAAKLLRERLDDAKRHKEQEHLANEWATKAQALMAVAKLNIADALAWQRDAAKAGAPLSKEPLAGFKLQLADRVRAIEDLQHQTQVQREAAVLMAQRIEVWSTKSWREAQGALDALGTDVNTWQAQAAALVANPDWASVDLKFAPLLDASRGQLLLVWNAFQLALKQALDASNDAAAELPPVAVWADELRAARGVANPPATPPKPKVDPEVRAAANAAVQEAITKLETQTSEGHGKASAGAAQALRHALKEFGKAIDSKVDGLAHAALAAAGELEGWQRWRADQLREELLIKAEGLLKRPEGQAIGGRKMQDMLRTMREQWKQTDQGGLPNHALWKRFDEACNEAYKVVEAWLEKIKADAIEHRKQRLALIEEVKAWAEANRTALDEDWKGFSRILHQFGDRWRDAGHLGEKAFAELQPLWKAAISHAAEPLETMQTQSLQLRHAMIEEAKILGEAAVLRIDAVKGLQQRWQAQAHAVPIDRRQEQKLWDAFRKPIDDAFQRKSAEREKAEASLGARDRVVLDASKALQAANAAGDAQAIRAAMAALEAALHGQAQAQAVAQAAGAHEVQAQTLVQEGAPDASIAADPSAETEAATAPLSVTESTSEPLPETVTEAVSETASESDEAHTSPPPEKIVPKAPPKPVVAMRGDDRPGMKKEVPSSDAGRFGKPGMRRDAGRSDSRPPRQDRSDRQDRTDRPAFDPKNAPPRLGDAAFRAQREALDNAQFALKKLAAQAHGEALTQLLTAWETKNAAAVPSVQDLGNRVNAATRTVWVAAIGGTAPAMAKPVSAQDALLRLEMAAEVPTPADHLDARRALQLQLLTRRNDPAPQQTWGHDAAVVLSSSYGAEDARRVQNTLKVLLKR